MNNENMRHNEESIENLYQRNLEDAYLLLSSLQVAEGRKPNIKGLNGWVYEQTIRYCLCQELLLLGLSPIIREQVYLYGRARIDLLVGKVAIEIKALGSFGSDIEKYKKYRAKVEEKGWTYFYLTRSESYRPYRIAFESIFGKNRSFFLDTSGDWARFISEVRGNLVTIRKI